MPSIFKFLAPFGPLVTAAETSSANALIFPGAFAGAPLDGLGGVGALECIVAFGGGVAFPD